MKRKVKKIVLIVLLILLMAGCSKQNETIEPVRVDCYRRWLYAFDRYSEDKEYISRLYEAISSMKLGEETDVTVTDYTDIIEFTFSDGHKERYIFEADMYMDEQQKKYIIVEGLPQIRSILDELMMK